MKRSRNPDNCLLASDSLRQKDQEELSDHDQTTRDIERQLGVEPERANSGDDNEEEGEDEDDENSRTTEIQTLMHILKANIGTGVLAMPLAFKHVGLWVGLLLMPVIGGFCIHCMNILINSGNELSKRFHFESLNYDQVAALGFACGPKWARRIAKHVSKVVTMLLMLTQLGACCVYILFTVENLQEACHNLFGFTYPRVIYLLALFPVIYFTSCFSNLRLMARVSTLANCLQLFGLSIIFFDLLQFHTYSKDEQAAGDSNRVDGVAPEMRSGLPIFFAIAVYSFEGIGVVLPLVKEMEDPRRIGGLNGVLNTAMSCVGLLYMTMGFFGYAKYGQSVQSVITLNLPQGTLNEIVRLAYALAVGLSFSLQFYVPWTIVWPVVDEALFFEYRPRKPRKKLELLNNMSAENQWTIEPQVMQQSGTKSERNYGSTGGGEQNNLQSNGQTKQQVPGSNQLGRIDERNGAHSADLQWRPLSSSMRRRRKMIRYSLIFVGVLLTFVAAALIPRLDAIISLIGAGASSTLAIIFPATIQLFTFWNQEEEPDRREAEADQEQVVDEERASLCERRKRRKRLLWHLFVAKNLFLVKFGILGLITGTWISLRELSE